MDTNHLKSVKLALASVALTSIPAGFLGYSIGKGQTLNQADHSRNAANPRWVTAPTTLAPLDRDHSRDRPPEIQQASRIRRQFASAMKEAGHNRLSSVDFSLMFELWESVGNSDAHQIETLLRSLERENQSPGALMTTALLAHQFGRKGGAAAAEYFLSLDKSQEQITGFSGAMVGWMRENPEAAYAWLQRNQEGLRPEMNYGELSAMYFSLKSKSDYAGTVQQALSLGASQRPAVLKLLAEQAAADPAQRSQLLESLHQQSDEKLAQRVENQLFDELTRHNPAEAMAVLAGLDVSEDRRSELEKNSLKLWSNEDPQGAIRWQSELLAGKQGAGDEIADTFRNWVGRDEAAASEWLRAQSDEFKTDLIFQKAGEVLQYQSPERAAQWHSQVFDDSSRQQAYRKLYHRWKTQSPDAAETWKDSLPLEDREKL